MSFSLRHLLLSFVRRAAFWQRRLWTDSAQGLPRAQHDHGEGGRVPATETASSGLQQATITIEWSRPVWACSNRAYLVFSRIEDGSAEQDFPLQQFSPGCGSNEGLYQLSGSITLTVPSHPGCYAAQWGQLTQRVRYATQAFLT